MIIKSLTMQSTLCQRSVSTYINALFASVILFLVVCYIPTAMAAKINNSNPTMRLEGVHTFTATPKFGGSIIFWVVDKSVNGKVSTAVFTAIGGSATFDLAWDRGNTTYTIKASDNGIEDELKVQVFQPNTEIKYQFNNPFRNSPAVTVRVLVPSSLNPDTPVVSVHHGSSRANYYAYWENWGKQQGWIIIAPHFPDSGQWARSRGYNLGNMFTGDEGTGNLNPEEKWSYRVAVDLAVSILQGFNLNDQTFDMWGHSAGGQFTHRTMLFVRDAPIRRGLPANPGWWTLPVFDEFERNFKYPYGPYHPLLDYDVNDILRFTNMHGIVNAGDQDTSRGSSLRTTPEAEAQGRNRWERANNMFANIGSSNPNHNWEFFAVTGIGHDGQLMSEAAQNWLLNNPPTPAELAIRNVTATGITTSRAVISWNTNTSANSLINYGISTNYNLSASDQTLSTSHSLSLSNLQPDTQYHYQVTSSDNNGALATSTNRTFTTLNTKPSGNLPPTANAGPDQTVNEGATVTLAGSGTDPDGNIVEYIWRQISGPDVALTSQNSATTEFTAPFVNANALLKFRLEVIDDGGGAGSNRINISVNDTTPPSNLPPVSDAGSDQTVDEEVTVTLDGRGSVDPDGSVVAYKWEQLSGPEFFVINNPNSAMASFTAPDVAQDAVFKVRLTVTDDSGTFDRNAVKITVRDLTVGNLPPVSDAGPDQTVDEGTTVTLTGSGTDQHGFVRAYNWIQLSGPPVVISGRNVITNGSLPSVTASFTAPDVTADTLIRIRLLVTNDRSAIDRNAVDIIVKDPAAGNNLPPVSNAGLDQTVGAGTTITLDGSGSTDPDGSIVAYKWIQLSGPAVVISNKRSAMASFTAPDVTVDTVLRFRLRATDSGGIIDRNAVNITVTAP